MSDEATITNNISPMQPIGNEHALFEIQKSLIRVENNQEKSAIKLDGVVELMKKDVSIVKDDLGRVKLDLDHHKGNMKMALDKITTELEKKVVEKEEMDELRRADEENDKLGQENSRTIARIMGVGSVLVLMATGGFAVLSGWVSAVAAHH